MEASVWKNRNFRLVLIGGLVNNIGDWLLAVALPAFVYTQTGSGRSTAAIVVVELAVGIAFGAYGGALADRWDLRRSVIGTNLLQAIALLPLLAVQDDRLWPAFVVALAQGAIQQVNNPASFALVPRIVPSDQLVQANSANTASSAIARLIGSPLGGITVAFGGLSTVVMIDVISFVVVAAMTYFVAMPERNGADEGEGHGEVVGEVAAGAAEHRPPDPAEPGIRSGWQRIRTFPALVGYLGVQSLASLTFAMFPVLFIVFVVDVLDGDEALVGIIRGTAAFGGLAAAAVVGRFASRVSPTRLMMWGYVGLGAVAFAFVNVTQITTAVWVFLVLFAMSGFPNLSSQIGADTTAQRLCPPDVLGRLMGLLSVTSSAGALIGSIGVGLLIDVLDVRLLLNVQAGLYVCCGLGTLLFVTRPASGDPADIAGHGNI
jgi:Na+/melibiose symporter-like transporter